MSDDAPGIADYALIGDTRSAALVSKNGSIDWLCWPRFDSASVFARILDRDHGGYFSIQPSVPFQSKRRYIEATNVLETTFTCENGIATLTDLMPVMREVDKFTRLAPLRQLLRRVEVTHGQVPFIATYAPRPDYARARVPLNAINDSIRLVHGPAVFHLRSDAPFQIEEATAVARFELSQGSRHDFALAFDDHSPAVIANIGDEATREIERTIDYWREWSAQLDYRGPHRDLVQRSVLTLKLMTYAPSGAIIAAPTTSLPECIGGIRNWDYRYCWLRDASFTAAALYDSGFETEGGAFVNWLCYSTQLTHPHLRVLYDVFGEPDLKESTLDHLAGYANSKPVRIGNDAREQLQLDIYGEVLGAIEEYVRSGETLTRGVRKVVLNLANTVAKRWREPDSGIWEKRSTREHHTHGKVMCWSALDTAERLTGETRWRNEKEAIRRDVFARGFNRELNSFVSIFDGTEVDASLLYLSRVGFIDPNDPQMLSTIDLIRRRLARGVLLYRYELSTEDGLPPGEGAFLPCSFWLVESLALAGKRDEAATMLQELLAYANDLGLFSEEIETTSSSFLGNFPQALTHIAFINAALCLHTRHDGRSQRRSGTT